MDTTQNVEDRLSALEKEVRQLRLQVAQEQGAASGRTAPDFLDRFAGIFADDPTFDASVRLGREWRNADRPQEDPIVTAELPL